MEQSTVMYINSSNATMSVGQNLLAHIYKNCTHPAVEKFPQGLFTREQRLQGALIVHILAAIYIIIALTVISRDYFVPAMEKFLSISKIDANIAGAAVMATAASTPQLATGIIGQFVSKTDIGVGAVLGSTYFNLFFIVGLCALAAKEPLQLASWPVVRDTFFFILSAFVLFILLSNKWVTWWNALILVLTYGLYIVALVFNSTLEHAFTQRAVHFTLSLKQCYCRQCRDKATKDDCENCGLLEAQEREENKDMCIDPKSSIPSTAKPTVLPQATDFHKIDAEDDESVNVEYRSILHHPEVVWKQVLWVLLMPALLVVYILIPDCRRPNSYRYMFVFTIIMSVVVISFSSYFLVWMVAVIGTTIGISDTMMGLTLLAWSAAVPDMLNAIFAARRGYVDMAVCSCIGSNIFDILVCLGLPWLLRTLFVNQSFSEYVSDDISTISIILIVSALVFLLFLCFTIWRLTTILGCVFMAAYFGFVSFTSYFSLLSALPACETTV